MSTTPTPRTDAEANNASLCDQCVPADFARQLETELAEAKDTIAKMEEHLNPLIDADTDLQATLTKLAESEAACAAMRAVIVATFGAVLDTDGYPEYAGGAVAGEYSFSDLKAAQSALTQTAGADMIARLQKAETSLAALKEWNAKKEFIFDDMLAEIEAERTLADQLAVAVRRFQVFHPECVETGAELPREHWTEEYRQTVDGGIATLAAHAEARKEKA